MTDVIRDRVAKAVRGLRDGETIRSWHGGVRRGHSGGYYMDIYAYTTQRRRYRLGMDVYGSLYVSEGRSCARKMLGSERRWDDIDNDLRVFTEWRKAS